MPRLPRFGAFLLLSSIASAMQQDSIERIEIQGNVVVDAETYRFHLTQKVGDPYEREQALRDYRELWNTGFLDDLTLEVTDGERGKIVTYIVIERPRVQALDFVGSKELSATDISDKLTEENASIPVGSFYDPAKIVKAEKIIRTMLVDKGRSEGGVSSRVEVLDTGGVKVVFDITDEQKVRIRRVHFEGIEKYDDWRLRWAMKKTRESHFLGALMGGSTYTEEQYAEDLEKVREVYLDNGYVDVSFGLPSMEYEEGHSRFLLWTSPKRWLDLTIPVVEGKRYQVGTIDVEGAEVFPPEFIKAFFKLGPGDIYNESRITKGLESLREVYGARGYVQFTGFPIKRPVPESDVVDVTININEDKQYFVNRIEFKGNSTTRDKVIRREMWLNEQDVMNMELLKASIRRINQLGYFQPIEQPDIQPVEGEDAKLDITLRLAEQNRNQFTFGGGVSGLEGAFINLAFSTTNFLGRGETASFSLQTGSRTRNFQIAITDPYFMDLPITLGFDVFKRTLKLPQFTRQDTGGSLIWGIPVKRFSRLFLNYNYSVIKTTEPDPDLQLNYYDIFTDSRFFDPRFYGIEGNFTQSKITPSLVHNTTDSPLFPTRGKRYTTSFEVAGGILGGTVNYYKPTFEGVWYLPVTRTTSFGFRTMASWLKGFAEGRVIDGEVGEDGTAIFDVQQTGIPFFERFFLGGENQIRGYDIRTVGPTDPLGRFIGGSKMLLFNAEYYIPLAGPLRAVLFFDAGQAYLETTAWSFSMLKELRTSTGAEMRFFVPVLNVPFRLIWAYNPHRDAFQPATAFRFGIGTTF
ncbi:MAG TPA: outer membrane protein assembly factor BamA [Vicinamibacteria bacterium]|nr:outer membrane protein assembly factor BamA [Vicinamibacteria bacterium]